MFKFLRKYNKWILVVGGILLLIAFLIPEAIQSLGQYSSGNTVTMATIDGEKISAIEWQNYASEHKQLQLEQATDPFGFGPIKEPAHWFLLVREAQQAGLVGPYAPDATDGTVLSAPDLATRSFLTASAHADGVRRLVVIFRNSVQMSDRRIRQASARLFHQVSAQPVVIKADPSAITTEPSEETLVAHFEKYKDAAANDDGTGFSYRLPNRVKLEWLEVPATSVEDVVKSSEAFSSVAQRIHWKKDPNKEFPVVDPTSPVPDIVKDDLLAKLVAEKVDEISKFAANELRMSLRGLPEAEGYVELPADWAARKPRFEDLAQKIQAEFKIALPAYHAGGDTWMGPIDLAKLPGIGDDLADTEKFGTPMNLSTLASFAKEFGGTSRVSIQKDVAGPPLTGRSGALYFFRILDTDAARAPKDLAEVREKVTEDVKRLEHFEQLKAKREAILADAKADGLLALAVKYGAVVELPRDMSLGNLRNMEQMRQFGMPVQRRATPVTNNMVDEQVIEQIIDFALTLPQDRPMADLPVSERLTVAESERHLALVVASINQQTPVSDEDFVKLVDNRFAQQFAGVDEEARKQALIETFKYEAMVARHNFVLLDTREEEVDPALQAAAQ